MTNTDEVVQGQLVPTSLGLNDVELMLLDTSIRVSEDPEAAARAIVERILGAETIEEAYGVDEVTHCRDILGVPIVILSARWQRSGFEEGAGIYAIIDGVTKDGQKLTVSCGARTVMAQLVWSMTHNDLPNTFYFEEKSRPTSQGFYPIKLVRVDETKQGKDF